MYRFKSLALAVLAVLCACGSSANTGATGPTVGLVELWLTDPFQVATTNATIAEAKAAGLNLLAPANPNNDLALQVTDMKTLIDQGAKGLIVIPVDSAGIKSGVDYAKSKSAPVVAMDTDAPGVYMNVRSDSYAMAAADCDYIGKATGGHGTVLMTTGPPQISTLKERIDGFMDCVAKNYPGLKVIQVLVGGDSSKCANAVSTVFASNPDTVAIYNHSDAVCAKAVENALKALGKLHPVGQPGHIIWAAIDGSPDGLQAIRDGYLDQTMSQPANLYAKYAVYWLKQGLNGVKPTAGPSDHGSTVKVVNNVYTDLLLAPAVTKANVDDPTLWGNTH